MVSVSLSSTRRRARGNWWYRRGEAQLAVQLYRRALDVLDESEGGITEPTPSGELAPTSDDLQVGNIFLIIFTNECVLHLMADDGCLQKTFLNKAV